MSDKLGYIKQLVSAIPGSCQASLGRALQTGPVLRCAVITYLQEIVNPRHIGEAQLRFDTVNWLFMVLEMGRL